MTQMEQARRSAGPDVRAQWLTGLLLLLLLAAAAVLRFHQIGAQSLWLDEYWALYLATGRGDEAFNRPLGVVLDPPPNVGFAGAPHWWRIWTGIDSTTHPPLYHLVLRWWVDLFGDADSSTHALSAVLSIAAIALFFDVLRPLGRWRALLGAGLMTFAPAQIYFAHETRPYALLMVTALLTARLTLAIVRLGPGRLRVIGLAFCAVLFALTHYLSAGALIGVGIFAALALRDARRRAVLATLLAALMIVITLWGPQFWRAREIFHQWGSVHHFEVEPDAGPVLTASLAARVPARLTVAMPEHTVVHPLLWAPYFILALLIPLASLRRSPEAAFWWFWVVGSVSFVAFFDVARHAAMLQSVKYIFLASPGIYALLATPLPIRSYLRWLPPAVVLITVVLAGVQRFAQGEPRQPDWRTMAQLIQRNVGARDVLAFIGSPEMPPVYYDIIFRHYAPKATNPILLLENSPDPKLLDELSHRPRIWVLAFGQNRLGEMFPGWRIGPRIGGAIEQSLQQLTPPAAG
jgi:hypothetical protein